MADIASRFWSKVEKSETCWVWTGTTAGQGCYGWFHVSGSGRDRVGTYAHRWSYTYATGPVPEGMEVDHLCCNRKCVRPSHLEPVTHAENQRRRSGVKHGPYNVGTHCRQGHERTTENTGFKGNGARYCKPCARAASARFREERSAR